MTLSSLLVLANVSLTICFDECKSRRISAQLFPPSLDERSGVVLIIVTTVRTTRRMTLSSFISDESVSNALLRSGEMDANGRDFFL